MLLRHRCRRSAVATPLIVRNMLHLWYKDPGCCVHPCHYWHRRTPRRDTILQMAKAIIRRRKESLP
eukprot:1944538-Pyramimonas_sp.AAC.1